MTPARSATLAVVVVSWNTRELLRRCLASLHAFPPDTPMTVWVVDNASSDGSAEMVRTLFPAVRLLAMDRNLGFSAGNNVALRELNTDFVLLLNPDTEVTEGALDRVLELARSRGTAVAARLLNPDGTLQHSCFRFPSVFRDLAQALWAPRLLPSSVRGRIFLGGYWSHDEEREVDWALGAFLLVPKAALRAAGPLPEEYALFGEDMEWCLRLREAGFPLRFTPAASVVHHGNQAAGQLPPPWRIRRTHDAQRLFLESRRGALVAGLHRGVLLLNYALRLCMFSLLGVASDTRRRQARDYRTILTTLLTRTGADGGP